MSTENPESPAFDTSCSSAVAKREEIQDENQNEANEVNSHHPEQTTEMECVSPESKCGVYGDQIEEDNKETTIFRCLVCRKNSSSLSSHKSHVASHIFNVPIYQCKGCKAHFTEKKGLLRHTVEICQGSKGYVYKGSYVCSLCGRRFAKKLTCVEHIVHHDSMTHSCNQCGWLFDTLYRVHVHKALWHPGEKSTHLRKPDIDQTNSSIVQDEKRQYKCWVKDCEEFLNGYNALTIHMKSVHKSTSHVCKLCTRHLRYKETLDSHLKSHNEMNYVCPVDHCGAMFETFMAFRNHYRERHNTDAKNFDQSKFLIQTKRNDNFSCPITRRNCKICNRSFLHGQHYEYHIRNHDKMTFVCKYNNCGWAFEKTVCLRSHMRHKHDITPDNFDGNDNHANGNIADKSQKSRNCTTCNRFFFKEEELEYHIKNHDRMTYICNNCGAAFEKYHGMASHSLNKHGIKLDRLEENGRNCTTCNRYFSKEEELEYHIKNHDRMAYICNNCGAAFEKYHGMASHSLYKHGIKLDRLEKNVKEDMYRKFCETCNRSFTTGAELEYHIKNHDRMTYICNNCGAAFEKYHGMASHSLNKHGIKLDRLEENENIADKSQKSRNCTICNRFFSKEEELEYHIENHDQMKYVCERSDCLATFEKFQYLANHSLNKHGVKLDRLENSNNCKTCTRTFPNEEQLEYHVKNHDKMTFVCQLADCGWAFEKNQHLGSHSLQKHGIKLGSIDEMGSISDNSETSSEEPKLKLSTRTCHLCGRNFNNDRTLEYHLQHHSEMKFVCQMGSCKWVYEKFSQLQYHYNDHHKAKISLSDAYKFKIPEQVAENAGSEDYNEGEVKSSVVQQPDNAPPLYDDGNFAYTCTGRKCGICRRYFINDNELDYHEKNHDKMQHVCQYSKCGFMYEEQSQLQLHYDVRHNRRKEVNNRGSSEKQLYGWEKRTCKICDRRFQYLQALEYHMQHHDEMIYKCQENGCRAMFENMENLQKHYGTRHKKGISIMDAHFHQIGERNDMEMEDGRQTKGDTLKLLQHLACSICGRFFNTYSRLTHHLQNHNQMKYMCRDGCGFMYLEYKLLIAHYYAKHQKGLGKNDEYLYMIKDSERTTPLGNMPIRAGQEKASAVSQQKVTQKSTRMERTCKICNRYFNRASGYEVHVQNHGKMKYKCQHDCGYMYQKFTRLQLHCRDKHQITINTADKATYSIAESKESQLPSCPICKRQFKGQINCEEHVRSHSNMIYKCAYCKWQYEHFKPLCKHYTRRHGSDISSANKEQFKINPREKEPGHAIKLNVSSCSICKRKFHMEERCKQHTESHDKMVFRCQQCGWMYEDFELVRGHCFRVHETNLSVTDEMHFKVDTTKIMAQSEAGFTTKEGPTEEKSQDKKERTYKKCPKCSRKITAGKYDDHVLNHDNMMYKCLQCGWLYGCKEFQGLYRHSVKQHNMTVSHSDERYRINPDNTAGETTQLDTDSTTEEGSMDTISMVGKEGKFQCSICGRKVRPGSYSHHVSNHDKMVYKCLICGWMYEEFSTLYHHYYGNHDTSISKSDEQKYKIDPDKDEPIHAAAKPDTDLETAKEGTQTESDYGMHDTSISKSDEQQYKINFDKDEPTHAAAKPDIDLETAKEGTQTESKLICTICSRRFISIENCANHIKNHDDMVYRCYECGSMYSEYRDLQMHCYKRHEICITVDDRKMYHLYPDKVLDLKCPQCMRKFKDEEKCAEHIKNHDDLLYKCLHCGWMYNDFQFLRGHYYRTHSTNIYVTDKKKYLVNTKKVETKTSIKACDSTNHSDKVLKKTCPQCTRKFKDEEKCAEHIKNHDHLLYKCLQCGWMYKDFEALRGHCSRSHSTNIYATDKKTYLVNTKKVETKTSIKACDSTNHSDKVLKKTCPQCTRKFKDEEKCAEHIKNHDHLLYKCLQCGWMYKDFEALRGHYSRSHSTNIYAADKKKYQVNIKKVETTLVKTLADHQGSEEQHIASAADTVVQYKCFRCGKMFPHFSNLQDHYSNQHNTNISSDSESLCKVGVPKPKTCETQDQKPDLVDGAVCKSASTASTSPKTKEHADIKPVLPSNTPKLEDEGPPSKDSPVCRSPAVSPRPKEDVHNITSSPGDRKRKRMTEEEVIERMKKRRRTTSDENQKLDEMIHKMSPVKDDQACSRIVKIVPIDKELTYSVGISPKRSSEGDGTGYSLQNGTS